MVRKDRILVVDDEPQALRLHDRILRDHFILETASCGAEALLIARNFQPDLILLDINMPGMDGYETCRRIRTNSRHSLTKIFMVSGRDLPEERVLGYEAGADDYIVKPFNVEELRAKIRVFLRLRRMEEIDKIKNALLEILSAEAIDPLRDIIDATGELIDDPQTPEHIWKELGLIYRSAAELNRFTVKADRLRRLRQQKYVPHYTEDSLFDHLTLIVRKWMPAADQKGLRITCDCSKEETLSADWNALDEVFGYLMDNAVRYSDEDRLVGVQAYQLDGNCVIRFRNQGRGIDPLHYQKGLFTPFYSEDTMHHHKGHGLSLAIAKELIDIHQGQIRVENDPENTTVFTLSLPLSQPQSLPPPV